MDPAALGTLILGLEDVRRPRLDEAEPIPLTTATSRRTRLAAALASALRAMADTLEPSRSEPAASAEA